MADKPAQLMREAADRLESQRITCRYCGPEFHDPRCLIHRLRTSADQMEGMVLVPVQPTEAMIEAGEVGIFWNMPESRDWAMQLTKDGLKAMISASVTGKG